MKTIRILKLFAQLLCVFSTMIVGSTAKSDIVFERPQSEAELNELLGYLSSSALPQAVTLERCIRETNDIVMTYGAIRNIYMSKVPSPLPLMIEAEPVAKAAGNVDPNLYRNYQEFKNSNAIFFEALNTFIESEKKIISTQTLSSLDQSIRSYDERFRSMGNQLFPISLKETELLILLDTTKDRLNNLLDEKRAIIEWILSPACEKAKVSWKLLYLQTDLKEILVAAQDMRNFTLALRTRRINIVERVKEIGAARLTNLWREKFFTEAQKTSDEISGLLEVVRLGEEFEKYWIMTMAQGLGQGLHLKELAYLRPLQLMITDLGVVVDYEEKLSAVKYAPEDIKNIYLGKVFNKKELLKKEIDALETKGFKGQLARQLILNRKRLENTSTNVCRTAIEEHEMSAEKTENLNQFERTAILYKKAIVSCQKS